MRFSVAAIVCAFASAVQVSALTYKLAAHEQACFHMPIERPGQKIAFYYAVQSGGAFDIDVNVYDSSRTVIYMADRSQQEEVVLTATDKVGEYSFCFSNAMSTFAEKTVFFNVALDTNMAKIVKSSPGTATAPAKPSEMEQKIEDSIERCNQFLSNLWRNGKYFTTRLNRNFSTVKSTEGNIFYFAILESSVILGMAFLQVFVVRTFFKSGKGRV